MVPKRVFSVWLGGNPPELVKKCLKTHEIPGYEHRLITEENCFKDHPYVKEALGAKKWVKAADFLRLWYLNEEGGIYLDADMEVLKPLDDLLDNEMFTCREENGFIANSVIGSIAGHPVLKKSLDEMTARFKGNDDKVFEAGMEIFSKNASEDTSVKVLTADFFFPYNHQTGVTKHTENTRCFHHFLKSWVPKELPPGWFNPSDVQVYRDLIERLSDGGTMAELGTAKGRSICSVADIVKRKNLKVYAVDTYEGTENEGNAHADAKTTDWEAIFRANVEAFGITDNVTVLRGRTDERFKDVPDGSLDLVFADADHSADAVEADIKNWRPKLKEKGILCGHDFNWYSVQEGIRRHGIEPVNNGVSSVWWLFPVEHSEKPLWTTCLISRNESKTLPRALESLKEFRRRGGQVVVVDTGSTDNTAQIARDAGCIVEEVGDRFLLTITPEMADAINRRFVVEGEEPIIKARQRTFDFGSARNYCSLLSPTPMVSMMDCDEVFTSMDIDKVNELIQKGWDQFEYDFVFSHDANGKANIHFTQSKFYSKEKLEWRHPIHEALCAITDKPSHRKWLDSSIFHLEHWQNEQTDRSGYLRGLAVDCYRRPDEDRQAHYFARELMYHGRFRSAIKEFERHIAMDRWPTEKSQSYIFKGDCHKYLGQMDKAIECYHKAFEIEGGRREPLLRLAEWYSSKLDHLRVVTYAMAAIQIPKGGFYANDYKCYGAWPHELLYLSLWQLGRIKDSKEQWEKALELDPTNSKYLFDARWYMKLPKVSVIIPQLGREEGLKRMLESVEKQNYPKELIEVIVDDREEPTVPEKVRDMEKKATGEYVLFGANDLELEPDCLIQAVLEALGGHRLVSLNDGDLLPDEGNNCAHFLLKRDLIPALGGEIFDTEFTHVGVDNLLWAKAYKLGEFVRCEKAKAIHHHFSRDAKYDWVYERGWKNADKDRALLERKLASLLAV